MFLTTSALKARFETNLAQSSRVEIATAWATEGPTLDLLCKAADVRGVEVRAIVGTYGNATHPEALERLRKIGTLRLAKDNGPMFHPKVYIFHGSAESCAWIGSAHFTGAGFARNEEVVHETDDVAGVAQWFTRRWRACGRLAPDAIDKYRERRRSQGVSRGLTGVVGRANQGKQRLLRSCGHRIISVLPENPQAQPHPLNPRVPEWTFCRVSRQPGGSGLPGSPTKRAL